MASRFDVAITAMDPALRHSRPLRNWLRSRRWCGESIGLTTDVAVTDSAILLESASEAAVLFLLRAKDPGEVKAVHLPLSLSIARSEPDAFEMAAGSNRFFVTEAERRPAYARFLADGFRRGAEIRTSTGDLLVFRGERFNSFRGAIPLNGGDSSNLLVGIATGAREVVVKSYKLLDPNNREPDVLARLQRNRFPHIPPYLGEFALGTRDERVVLGIAMERVNAADQFTGFREGWRGVLRGASPDEDFRTASNDAAGALGEATAALHEALVDRRPGPWRGETFTEDDERIAFRTATGYLSDALRRLGQVARASEPTIAGPAARARSLLLELRPSIEERLKDLEANVGTLKIVTHGDLHLAQVLRRLSDGRLLFIDFEGEPERSPRARAAKQSPLRDVGTLVRSFAYVKHYVWLDFVGGNAPAAPGLLEAEAMTPEQRDVLEQLLAWESAMVEQFAREYVSRSTLHANLERATINRIIQGWTMEKALYELEYELKHRPENLGIPLEGIVSLAGGGRALR